MEPDYAIDSPKRQLVEAISMKNECRANSKPAKHFRKGTNEFWRKDTDGLNIGKGGVIERSQDVEDGAKSQLLTNRRGVTQGGMKRRRKEERHADPSQEILHLFLRQIDRDAERFQNIGAPASRAGRPISVFGDNYPRRRHNDGRNRRDVKSPFPVSARPARIEHDSGGRIDTDNPMSHRARATDDLIDGFAFDPERRREGRNLRRGGGPIHDGAHGIRRFISGKVLRTGEFSQNGLYHSGGIVVLFQSLSKTLGSFGKGPADDTYGGPRACALTVD